GPVFRGAAGADGPIDDADLGDVRDLGKVEVARNPWADVTGGGVRGLLAGQDEIVPADLLDRLAERLGRRDRSRTAEEAVRQADRPVRAHRHRPLEALVEGCGAHG